MPAKCLKQGTNFEISQFMLQNLRRAQQLEVSDTSERRGREYMGSRLSQLAILLPGQLPRDGNVDTEKLQGGQAQQRTSKAPRSEAAQYTCFSTQTPLLLSNQNTSCHRSIFSPTPWVEHVTGRTTDTASWLW